MRYRVEFSAQAFERMRSMDQRTVKLLLRWVENHLEGCENPRRHGKGFPGAQGVVWRYPIGHCRFMAEIQDEKGVVLLIWAASGYENDPNTAI